MMKAADREEKDPERDSERILGQLSPMPYTQRQEANAGSNRIRSDGVCGKTFASDPFDRLSRRRMAVDEPSGLPIGCIIESADGGLS